MTNSRYSSCVRFVGVLVAGACCAASALAQSRSAERDRPNPPATTQPSGPVDDELVKKLLGGRTTALDTVRTTLDRMRQAADRLTDRLDPGEKTQKMQKKIIEGLDELIQEASKQSGRSRKGASVRRRHRRPPRRRPRPASKSDGQSARAGPTPKAGKGAAGDGRDGGRDKTKTNKADLARRWGFLPEHDRLEISQGFDEEFLPKFRERILRYYRELAEQGRRE